MKCRSYRSFEYNYIPNYLHDKIYIINEQLHIYSTTKYKNIINEQILRLLGNYKIKTIQKQIIEFEYSVKCSYNINYYWHQGRFR